MRVMRKLELGGVSIVTMRSPVDISHDSALSSVVLPDPVPPATAKS